jgi:hypothetical protein
MVSENSLPHECFHGSEAITKAALAWMPAAYPGCFAKWLLISKILQLFAEIVIPAGIAGI